MENKNFLKLLNKKIKDFEEAELFCKNKAKKLIDERCYDEACHYCSNASCRTAAKEYTKALKKEFVKEEREQLNEPEEKTRC
jgi:ribosomal protein S20